MYWEEVYKSFKQLRKQLYKLKSRKQLEKYSKIESNTKHYKTFRRFCDDVNEYFGRRYQDEPTDESIQEIFDNCLDLSQKRQLHIYIFWF
jgi:hypothetical protein